MTSNLPPNDGPYWHASLNGYACEAFAWVQSTCLNILDGQGGVQTVAGVRRWRGRALIDREALKGAVSCDAPVRYTGKIRDGDDERDVNADVYLYFTRCQAADPDVHQQTYVEFIGAENPFKAI